jgi:hypothetical protein
MGMRGRHVLISAEGGVFVSPQNTGIASGKQVEGNAGTASQLVG